MKSLIPTAALSVLLTTVALAMSAIAAPPITTGVMRWKPASSLVTKTPRISPTAATPITYSMPGAVGFLAPPRLVSFNANSTAAGFPTTYELTLQLPATAGHALQAIKVTQAKNLDTVSFQMNDSQAMLASGAIAPLASIGGPEQPGDAAIVFDPPIAPGETITVELPVKTNPDSGGIYLFGVTAFPEGENVLGQFLGYGRLHFNNR